MERKFTLVFTALLVVVSSFANASDEHAHESHHGHEHQDEVAGPNGGKMILSVEPHIEFLMLEDKRAQVGFYDHLLEFVPHDEQFVALVGGTQKDPIKIHFEKQGDVLVSKSPLPVAKKPLPVVLIIKESKDAQMQYERFFVNLQRCSGCELQEYACICDHGHSH